MMDQRRNSTVSYGTNFVLEIEELSTGVPQVAGRLMGPELADKRETSECAFVSDM
jgi:hypothetical protein